MSCSWVYWSNIYKKLPDSVCFFKSRGLAEKLCLFIRMSLSSVAAWALVSKTLSAWSFSRFLFCAPVSWFWLASSSSATSLIPPYFDKDDWSSWFPELWSSSSSLLSAEALNLLFSPIRFISFESLLLFCFLWNYRASPWGPYTCCMVLLCEVSNLPDWMFWGGCEPFEIEKLSFLGLWCPTPAAPWLLFSPWRPNLATELWFEWVSLFTLISLFGSNSLVLWLTDSSRIPASSTTGTCVPARWWQTFRACSKLEGLSESLMR